MGLDLIDANFDFYAGSDFLDPTNKKAAGSNSESLYTLVDKAGYTIARGYKDYQKKQKIGQTDSLTTCDSNRQ